VARKVPEKFQTHFVAAGQCHVKGFREPKTFCCPNPSDQLVCQNNRVQQPICVQRHDGHVTSIVHAQDSVNGVCVSPQAYHYQGNPHENPAHDVPYRHQDVFAGPHHHPTGQHHRGHDAGTGDLSQATYKAAQKCAPPHCFKAPNGCECPL